MAADERRQNNSVIGYGWGKAPPVERWLFAEGHRFDFFQAVRLLEMIRSLNGGSHPASHHHASGNGHGQETAPVMSVGQGADPDCEAVRFKSAVSLDFPTSDIAAVNSGNGTREPAEMVAHFKEGQNPAEVTVNFMGLAGCLGALDVPTTERILDSDKQRQQPLRDFLDIFNHRLVSLLYRIREHHRVGLSFQTPGQDQISSYLFSTIGMSTPGLQARMLVRDRALLYYAGILSSQTRSMIGLQRVLADYFQVKVKGHQFQGKWRDLEQDQWTSIGASGRNQRLGRDTVVLGERIWDQQGKFEIELGPLSLKQYVAFLPTGWRFGVLCDLIRFYTRGELDFDIRLVLKSSAIPSVRMKPHGPRLGWTSWLSSTPASRKVAKHTSVTLSLESIQAETPSVNSHVLCGLPRGKQAELLQVMTRRTYPPQTVVIRQGSTEDLMYLIRRGKVQLIRRGERGGETTLGILKKGDCFGEQALLTKTPCGFTALTITECEIFELPGAQFEAFVDRYPSLRRNKDAYLAS